MVLNDELSVDIAFVFGVYQRTINEFFQSTIEKHWYCNVTCHLPQKVEAQNVATKWLCFCLPIGFSCSSLLLFVILLGAKSIFRSIPFILLMELPNQMRHTSLCAKDVYRFSRILSIVFFKIPFPSLGKFYLLLYATSRKDLEKQDPLA